MKRHSAKLILTVKPTKTVKAWLIDIKDQGQFWIPFTFIAGFNPVSMQIEIDTWILDQKGIKYKV